MLLFSHIGVFNQLTAGDLILASIQTPPMILKEISVYLHLLHLHGALGPPAITQPLIKAFRIFALARKS
jgi:hypothetical protein